MRAGSPLSWPSSSSGKPRGLSDRGLFDAESLPCQSRAMDEKRLRRWFRFTLRTWFVALTALCVWLGWWSQSALRQKAAAEKLRSSAVYVDYDRPHNRQPSIRERLANHIGFDFVYNVTEIHQGHGASATSTDEIIGCCDAFPHLKQLLLTSARPVADSDLEIVCRATNLAELWIWNSDAMTAQGLMRQ